MLRIFLLLILIQYHYAFQAKNFNFGAKLRTLRSNDHSMTQNLLSTKNNDNRLSMSSNNNLCATIQVSNLQKSKDFYLNSFGMSEIDTDKSTEDEVVLGYKDYPSSTLKLVAKNDNEAIILGDGYQGIGLNVEDADEIFKKAENSGGSVVTPLADYAYGAALIPEEDDLKQNPVRYGRLADPDGYVIEVAEPDILEAIKNPSANDARIKKFVLNVINLDETIEYYAGLNVGFTELRRRSNVNSIPKDASMVSFISASDTEKEPYIELVYEYATEKINVGSGFVKLEVGLGAKNQDPNGYFIE